MKLKLSDAATIMGGELRGHDAAFENVCTDTRNLQAGNLFFALRGANFNGEVFVEQAFELGACAAVVTKQQVDLFEAQIVVEDVTVAFGKLAQYKREQLKSKVIAVTGSCGKTSVKGMMKNIFELEGKTHATHANFNNHIGVPKTIFTCDPDVEYLVIEAGTSTPGEIGYLSQIIAADIAVVINVHPAHIQGFGSLDAIANEKSMIYSSTATDSCAVVNEALLKYSCIDQRASKSNRVYFGVESEGSTRDGATKVYADKIELNELGFVSFDLGIDDMQSRVKLNVQGLHQVENALAAAGCACGLGVSIQTIAAGLAAYKGEAGRMQIHEISQSTLIDDSYNANPASMRAAIDLVSRKPNSVLILGDMGELGEQAATSHREVGEYARNKGIKTLICKGTFADDYCDGFGSGALKFFTQKEIVGHATELMKNDVTILVKGSRFTRMDKVCSELLSLAGGL